MHFLCQVMCTNFGETWAHNVLIQLSKQCLCFVQKGIGHELLGKLWASKGRFGKKAFCPPRMRLRTLFPKVAKALCNLSLA